MGFHLLINPLSSNKMDTRFIYMLFKQQDIVHYIGKTKNPYQREKKHKIKYPNSTFEIIDEIPTFEWKFWERHYISLYRFFGFTLNNKLAYAGVGSDKRSDEIIKKISDSKKNKKPGINSYLALKLKLSFPVNQYTKNGEFIKKWESISEASRCLNINKSNIARTCKLKRKTAGKFRWKLN